MKRGLAATLAIGVCCAMAQASGYSDFVNGLSVRDSDDAAAVTYFTSALADPGLLANLRPVALYDRGLAYSHLKKIDLALADYSASLALQPQFDTYVVRAVTYERTGKPDAALADFAAAIATRPEIEAGYYDRAGFLLRAKRYAEALPDFTKVVELKPDDVNALVFRATVYRLVGNFSAAMDDADKAVHLNSKTTGGYLAREAIYQAQGKLDDALDAADDALDIAPKDTLILLENAILQWQLKKFPKALKTLDRAAAVEPGNGYVVLWQTIVRTDAAIADSDLPARAARVDLAKWPGVLVKLYAGQADIAAVMREARADDEPGIVDGQVCEANFYIAEWQRLQGHADLAPPLLQAAAADCPVPYAEKRIAASLLKAAP